MKKLTLIVLLLAATAAFSFRAQAQERPWMKYITPSGYFQAGYQFDDAANNTFYIKRARIALAGDLVKSERFGKFEYKVQAELAGSPKLVDYWVKWTIRDEFGIQFGQAKTPLTVENSEYAPLKLEMIDYSLLVQRFARMSVNDLSGISATGREMGVNLYGKVFPMADGHALVRYNVALYNGCGINKNDDDRLKNFMARLMIFPIKDLSVSGYYERRIGHMDEVPIYNDYDYRVFDRYGAAIAYDSKFAWFRTEYMAGHTFGWRAEAAYVTAGYKITPTFNVGARYDYFTSNSRATGFDQQYVTVGASWHPFPRLRLQLNYMHKQEPDRSVTHLVNFMSSIIL